jgi:hypothetical protein
VESWQSEQAEALRTSQEVAHHSPPVAVMLQSYQAEEAWLEDTMDFLRQAAGRARHTDLRYPECWEAASKAREAVQPASLEGVHSTRVGVLPAAHVEAKQGWASEPHSAPLVGAVEIAGGRQGRHTRTCSNSPASLQDSSSD